MKKIIAPVLLIISVGLITMACQNKEESKPQYQFPSGGPVQSGPGNGPVGGPMGGPIAAQEGVPLQNQDESRMLKEAAAKDPKNAEVWIRLGNMSMDNSRFQEAIEAYEKALQLDPKNIDVRVDLGTCYRNSGKPDLAVREYRKAIDANPNHLNAHKNLAIVLANDLKDKTQAIREYEKALQIAPNAPDAGQLRQEIQKMKSSK